MKTPTRIALTYFAIASLWSIGSDVFVHQSYHGVSLAEYFIEICKGLFFVAISAGLIYLLLHREMIKYTQVENELRQAEQFQRQVLENAPTSIFVIADKKIIYANPQATILLEAEKTEHLIGLTIKDLIAPDEWPDALERYKKMQNGGQGLYPVETKFVSVHGTEVAVSIVAKMFSFEGTRAVQIIALNINRRVQAERALQKQVQYQRALINLNNIARKMVSPHDFANITHTFFEQLKSLNLPIASLVTHRLLSRPKNQFETIRALPDKNTKTIQISKKLFDQWKNQDRSYQPQHNAQIGINESDSLGVRSFFDISFQNGLLSVLSTEENAFTEEDLSLIESMSQILDTAFARANDLKNIEQQHLKLQQANKELQQLSQHTFQIQEQERRTLAKELHDQIGQALASVNMSLRLLQDNPTENAKNIVHCVHTVDTAIHQVRSLSLNLRPSVLDDFGLQAALRWFVDQLPTPVININLKIKCPDQRYSDEIETACFRFVQEAVNNALRHAHANQINITLSEQNNILMIYVTDNGLGLDVSEAFEKSRQGQCLGLRGLQERIVQAGGRLEIASKPNIHTTLTAIFRLPVYKELTA